MAGRKISDHSFWAGGKPKGSVLPMGSKMKEVSGEEGFGALMKYEDTDEAIKAQQRMNKTKVQGHPQKPGFRN